MSMFKPRAVLIASCAAAAVLIVGLGFMYWRKERLSPWKQVSAADVSSSDGKNANPGVEEDSTISEDNTQPIINKVKVTFVHVNSDTFIRTKASAKADKAGVVDAGSEFEYLGESGAFYKIRTSGYTDSWILKSCCELFEKETTEKHIPKKVYGDPFQMEGTKEGEKLGAILHEYNAIGASVAVIKDGHVSYHYEYGYADRENDIPVAENTKFRVASISKVFTSMLAMTEVDDGKLDLDGDLSDVFGRKFRHPKYSNIPVTMRMLLTHTAGLSGKEGLYSEYLLNIINKDEYYSAKPGNRYIYSNLSIGIAGAVVEKVSDQTISQYARDRFFGPMGIDASFDGTYLSDKSLVANCYYQGRVSRSNEELTRSQEGKNLKPGEIYHLGQGGLLISAVDMGKTASVLLNNGSFNGRQYISEKSVKEMLSVYPVDTNGSFDQCIGIRRYESLVKNRVMYYHNGAFYGILALMAIDPSDGSGVIVITSGARSDRMDNTVFEVCNDVMQYCYSEII